MANWSPHDLPYQRDLTVHTLRDVAAAWDLPHWRAEETTPGATAHATRGYADALEAAPLYWLDKDVCGLVADTMSSVPPWSPQAAMPAEHGMIAFARPPTRMSWEGGSDGAWRDVGVDILLWTQRDPGTVTIRAMSRMQGHRGALSPLRTNIPFDEVKAVTIPVNAVTGEGVDVAVHRTQDYRGPLADAATLLSLAGATWLLMSQPAVVEDDEDVETMVKRPPRATKLAAPRRVPVRVSIRRLSAHVGGAGAGQRGKRRPPEHRWWVRGHWRQQAWGANRALRKPVFIAPHTAGPKDADLDTRPNVQVWREK